MNLLFVLALLALRGPGRPAALVTLGTFLIALLLHALPARWRSR